MTEFLDANQLADHLGIPRWKVHRGIAENLVPPADDPHGWSTDIADQLREQQPPLDEVLGKLPDVGAWRAAAYLTSRRDRVPQPAFTAPIEPYAVHEMHRAGLIRLVGWYKGHEVYSGLDLEQFDDWPTLARLIHDGKLLGTGSAVSYMRIRYSDFRYLRRPGVVRPARYADTPEPLEPAALYRRGDLDAILARTDIDWVAVRATPRGQLSLLATLTTLSASGPNGDR